MGNVVDYSESVSNGRSVMLCCVVIGYVTLRYVILCYQCYVMLCPVMLCYVMLCYVMLCYVISVMLCHVMLCCYVTLRFVTLRYVMLSVLCYVIIVLCCIVRGIVFFVSTKVKICQECLRTLILYNVSFFSRERVYRIMFKFVSESSYKVRVSKGVLSPTVHIIARSKIQKRTEY